MRGEIEFLALSVFAPAAAGLLVAWLCRRLLPADVGPRYSLAVGAAVGFAVGFELLPDMSLLAPQRHWQWLPHLALAAAVLGPVSLAAGVRLVERWLLFAAIGLLAAWQLVPTWPTLQPSRAVLVPLLAAYSSLLMVLIGALPARLRGRRLGGLFAATALVVSLWVAYEISVTFGIIGAVATAALSGCFVCPLLPARRDALERKPVAVGNLALTMVYAVLVGGIAFVGAVELERPRYYLLLAPFAPLVLWLFAFGPLARDGGVWRQPDD
jgi:hypothetical protein